MKKIKWKKVLLIILTSVGVIMIAAGSYAWNMVTSTFTAIHEEVDRRETEKQLEGINFEEGDPFSVLLMGIDEPENEDDPYQRSDTLVLLTINPGAKETHMVSIPRDTYTKITGKGEMDKINHSYAFGGTTMTVRTVEDFLDIPVHYFVRVNMAGFEDIVDAVDGVEVTNRFKFDYGGFQFEEGQIHLDGERALRFSQMRKDDPRGDFGRQERQRKVIQAVLNKGASLTSITNIEKILESVENNVRTNFSLTEIWDIQSNYRDALEHIEQYEIAGEDGEIDETYYFMPDEKKLEELSKTLNRQLER